MWHYYNSNHAQTTANNHFFSTIITMQPLTPEKVNHILHLLDLNHSACFIYCQTHISPNTICNICKKHCPNLQKSTRGCPKILSPIDLCHSTQLLTSGQVDTAPQLAHNLQEIKGRSVSAQTMHHGLKSIGMKATAKVKKPLLKPHYKRARMDFAEQYLH